MPPRPRVLWSIPALLVLVVALVLSTVPSASVAPLPLAPSAPAAIADYSPHAVPLPSASPTPSSRLIGGLRASIDVALPPAIVRPTPPALATSPPTVPGPSMGKAVPRLETATSHAASPNPGDGAAPRSYAVRFEESGLPSGTTWNVSLNGTTISAVAPSAIAASLPNGTFPYAIADVPGWHQLTLPYSGTVRVHGGRVHEPTLQFSEVLYSVRFNETGMPPAAGGGVGFNGSAAVAFGPGGVLAFDGYPNGSYPVTVAAALNFRLISPSPVSPVVISGSDRNVSLVFQENFSVNFVESGMPVGAGGTVSFNGGPSTPFGPGGRLVFPEPNGTYPYSVETPGGYAVALADPASPVVVNGSFVIAEIVFVAVFSVLFVESGLSATAWGLTFGGVVASAPAPHAIDYEAANGSYPYEITNVPGWHLVASESYSGAITVSGENLEIALNFRLMTYAVRFVEEGLQAGTPWKVTVNFPNGSTIIGSGTVTNSSVAPAAVAFDLPNGSFTFTVGLVTGYTEDPGAGLAAVDAGAVDVPIVFTPLDHVSFEETGLPTGIQWGVVVNGTSGYPTDAPSAVIVYLPGGSFPYAVDPVPGYTTTWTGHFVLTNRNATINVDFVPFTYPATFSESGLPSGTTWSVTLLDGTTTAIAPAPAELNVPNGSYPYFVSSAVDFQASPQSGAVDVVAAPFAVGITFHPVAWVSFWTGSVAGYASLLLLGIIPLAGGFAFLAVRRGRNPPRGSGPPPPGARR